MNSTPAHSIGPGRAAAGLAALAACLALCGCGRQASPLPPAPPARPASGGPLALALVPHDGQAPLDADIRRWQEKVRSGPAREAALERLGWLFVAKARESFDPGCHTLAAQCASALEELKPGCPEALLLRGHVLHSQHRFHEAAAAAATLVERRGLAVDHGLLGDILVDLGRVDEAAAAYQSMLDLKPDPMGYARAAHIRWLKGDLPGACEVMRMAANGASPADPEQAAWMQSQFARCLWQTGQTPPALQALRTALEFQTNYAPALVLRGRIELADARFGDAIQTLRQAAEANPLPESLWVLSEALRAAGRADEAKAVEARLDAAGASSDPRTWSLCLATQGRRLNRAVALARQELSERGDVFTHDALAWALAASGAWAQAQGHMERALAQGTRDARMFCHAAVIAARAGDLVAAGVWMAQAASMSEQLLPSEREHLRAAAALLDAPAPGVSQVRLDLPRLRPERAEGHSAVEN